MRASFKDLTLDDEGLSTPGGFMPLGSITKAEFVRNAVHEGGTPATETNTPGVVGGAVVGGVVAGAAGAVAGGLIGSQITTESGGEASYSRTVSASIAFQAGDVSYATEVGVFDVEDAEAFVCEVRTAAGLQS